MISEMLFLARADRGMIELNNEDIEVGGVNGRGEGNQVTFTIRFPG